MNFNVLLASAEIRRDLLVHLSGNDVAEYLPLPRRQRGEPLLQRRQILAGARFTGTTTNNTSTLASYGDYVLNGRVTSFTFTYTNAIPSGDGTRMITGIGDLSVCR